eukprot:NODE_29107_length_456_cov_2.389058.p5 GENE.NODE_29107_length_456_cov_2.389058~~NODE_29107_length_456_cov_2.389058.p5  ORF type:complete len:53 (-),score=5.03 NODE_29107_length_456_cov_2.389058:191-349(-)
MTLVAARSFSPKACALCTAGGSVPCSQLGEHTLYGGVACEMPRGPKVSAHGR